MGVADGLEDGCNVGAADGTVLGLKVGIIDGENDGSSVGLTEGLILGPKVGLEVGGDDIAGIIEGSALGAKVRPSFGRGRTVMMDIMPMSECSIMWQW